MQASVEHDIELGRQEIRDGNPDLAQARFKALLDQDGDCAAAVDGMARVALATGDISEAIRLSGKAVELEPGNPDLMNTLCLAWFKHGDHNDAIKLLVQTGNHHPGHKEVHATLADMLMAAGKNEMAFEVLEQYIGTVAEADEVLSKAGSLIDAMLADQRTLQA